jgi:[ribosomal protein S5]-alanine N-acetyltransferase
VRPNPSLKCQVTPKACVVIRPPARSDAAEFIAKAKASAALHARWVSAPSTRKQFLAYLERMAQPGMRGYLVCHGATREIAGVVNITNVVMGTFRSGYLGYYAFSGFEQRGVMRAGLNAVVRHAFSSLKLHRLEANIQSANAASIALVKSCGFSKEGYSPRYLKIAGRWRDHERWAIIAV